MKRLLITGGTGFVGKNIIPSLLDSGFICRCIIHNTPLPLNLKEHPLIEIEKADITKYSTLKKLFIKVDAVIHMAAAIDSVNETVHNQINIVGTENIVRAAKENNVKRIIFFSGYPAGLKKNKGIYGETKAKAENIIINSGLSYTIFRIGVLYGKYDRRNLSKLLLLACKLPFIIILGNGRNIIQPLYCSDLVQPLIFALNNSISYNKLYIL
ncbi:hypothetical protein DRQ09_03695, partial [candidate division KSB1 bacterium]